MAPNRAEMDQQAEALWEKRLELQVSLRLLPDAHATPRPIPLSPRARVAVALLKCLGLYGRGWRNACSPTLRQERFTFPNLPEHLDGFRILQISDIHYPPGAPDYAEAVTSLLAGQKVDLCVLTGDYRFGRYAPVAPACKRLGALLECIDSRLGMLAILGNHDLSDMVDPIRALGVRPLLNEGMALEGMWIAGVDDPHMYRVALPDRAMAGAPADHFVLFLGHSPECYAEAEALGADLYLCGHTHGGQIRLPGIGAIYTNARCPAGYVDGRWQHGKMLGYTTRGLGVTEVPVRYNCPPEATVITLSRES